MPSSATPRPRCSPDAPRLALHAQARGFCLRKLFSLSVLPDDVEQLCVRSECDLDGKHAPAPKVLAPSAITTAEFFLKLQLLAKSYLAKRPWPAPLRPLRRSSPYDLSRPFWLGCSDFDHSPFFLTHRTHVLPAELALQ